MTSPQTAQSRAGGTGSTAVITFEAVMKQSNEQNRDLTIADVAGRWMLNSRCHLFLLQKRHWRRPWPKPPVTGRFPVNAVRQEPHRGPELVPDDSYLLGQKQQQEPLRQENSGRFRPMQYR